MELVLLAFRIVLGAVLGIAGVAKLCNLHEFRHSLGEFGLPTTLQNAATFVIPSIECLTAVGLIWGPIVPSAAAVACLLLLGFSVTIWIVLRRRQSLNCSCFGRLHSGTVSVRTIYRNIVLAGMAAFLCYASAAHWSGGLKLIEFPAGSLKWLLALGGGLLVAGLVACIWIVVQLFRQYSSVQWRLNELERHLVAARLPSTSPEIRLPTALKLGDEAYGFELKTIDGATTRSLADLCAKQVPLVLIFVSTACRACIEIVTDLGDRWEECMGNITIQIVSKGRREENLRAWPDAARDLILLERDEKVAEEYGAYWTPCAVLVSPDGLVMSGLVRGRAEIMQLIDRVNSSSAFER